MRKTVEQQYLLLSQAIMQTTPLATPRCAFSAGGVCIAAAAPAPAAAAVAAVAGGCTMSRHSQQNPRWD
jgi:hypothetical protein